MKITNERLKEIAERRTPSLCWGEAEIIASELLANRVVKPFGFIDPANLKTYRGQMAGGSWSPVQRTLNGLNLTLPIYLIAPTSPDEIDFFAEQVIGNKKKNIYIPKPILTPQEGVRLYLNADAIITCLESQGLIVSYY